MISYQREFLSQVVLEVDHLLNLHYQELTLNKDKVKLNPMWSAYQDLETLERFFVYTAREDGELVGYSAFFVNHHLHYAELKVAINDVLFLHPDHRKGTTGIKLLKFCEKSLKDLGVNKLCWHCKLDTSLIPILKRLGYGTEEVSMAKFL